MDIYKLLKILSSESKAKMIIHLIDCNCGEVNVSNICHFTNLKQANVSKHIMDLREDGILHSEKKGREVIYTVDKKFKEKWGSKIRNIVNQDETLSELKCNRK